MNVKNCPECGKLFMVNPSGMCPECYEKEEIYEHKIGEFLREHGKASVEEIHQATGVKEKIILRMLKSGRLLTEGLNLISYPCDTCGAPIYEGRLCSRCGSNFTKQVREVSRSNDANANARNGVRMYSKEDARK
jgi:flagellar operon protein (TIGR03826 family)